MRFVYYLTKSFYLALELNEQLTEFSNLNVQALSLMRSRVEVFRKTRGSCAEKRVFEETDRSATDRIHKNDKPPTM